jgi:hypothetical protein
LNVVHRNLEKIRGAPRSMLSARLATTLFLPSERESTDFTHVRCLGAEQNFFRDRRLVRTLCDASFAAAHRPAVLLLNERCQVLVGYPHRDLSFRKKRERMAHAAKSWVGIISLR